MLLFSQVALGIMARIHKAAICSDGLAPLLSLE